MKKRMGFVGLGNMGMAMAKNLIEAGYHLQVYNRTPSKAEELDADSNIICKTPAEAADGVKILITMLSEDNVLKETVTGEDGILKTFPAGAVHISMSTIAPDTSEDFISFTKIPAVIISPRRYLAALMLPQQRNYLSASPAMRKQKKSPNPFWNAWASALLILAKK
jgi:hypothetical protein